MKYIISKEQYRRVLLKYLNSFIGDFIVDPYDEDYNYRNVKTIDGSDFATLWHAGPIRKGCKRELSLDDEFLNDFESLIPINRKKVFSEVVLEYFTLKTGIKCDCVEFNYFSGKYQDIERFDNDGEVITTTEKKFDYYQYKKPKKK